LMYILLISRCLPTPPLSGDRVILSNLTRELAARGHALELLAFHPDAEEPGPPSGEGFAHFEPIPERPRAPWEYLSRLTRPFPEAARRSWNPRMWHAIQRRLSARWPDIVHFHGGVQVYEFRDLIAPMLPNVIVPYESYSRYLEGGLTGAAAPTERLRNRAKRAIARRYESRIFKGFDRVVLVTQQDESYLRSLAPDLPTAVIPNGVDASYYRPAEGRSRTSSLVFVGNMTYRPNVEASQILIREILPPVKAEVPEVGAVIVGTQPPPALVALSGEDVQVTGWVPDIRPYLERAACFVSPLMAGTGIRNKILEAMAMRVPVVATPLSCEGIDVLDGENVLLGRTPQELAAAALRLLRDEPLRRTIAQSGQRLVRRRYTWGIVADRYEMLYDAVVGERRTQRDRGQPRGRVKDA
jgi:glycosyltransferase involved in cell wall biosynthesis